MRKRSNVFLLAAALAALCLGACKDSDDSAEAESEEPENSERYSARSKSEESPKHYCREHSDCEERVGEATFAQVSVGRSHACGVTTDGSLVCWGKGSDPDAEEGPRDYDQAVPPEGKFSMVGAGNGDTCGIRDDGTIVCWSDRSGEKELFQRSLKDHVPEGRFTQLDVSFGDRSSSACALREDGAVVCWTQRGAGDVSEGPYKDMASAGGYACGIRESDGGIDCWGSASRGQTEPPDGKFKAVAAAAPFACAIEEEDGSLACWGDRDNQIDMLDVPDGAFADVAVRDRGGCAIREDDGGIECWALGLSEDPPAGTFKSLSLGGTTRCAIRDDDRVACWTSSNYCNLGCPP